MSLIPSSVISNMDEYMSLGDNSFSEMDPLMGKQPLDSLVTDILTLHRLPGHLEDDRDSLSQYVSPYLETEHEDPASDSSESIRSMSRNHATGSALSHATFRTEATTPESATVALPKPDLYGGTDGSPKRQWTPFILPSNQLVGESVQSSDHGIVMSPPAHSTPELDSSSNPWSQAPSTDSHSASSASDDATKILRLEQSLDLLVFNGDEEDPADKNLPNQGEERPVLRSLDSEHVVVVFRSPALSGGQTADLGRLESPLSLHKSASKVNEVAQDARPSDKRAVIMSPDQAGSLLGFTPQVDVVVATVEDARQAARNALLTPGVQHLELDSALSLDNSTFTSATPALPSVNSDADLTDFSFLCDVMDTSSTVDDSFFSTVSEQEHDDSNVDDSSFSRSVLPSFTAERSTSSVLSRPRPRTYRTTRLNEAFSPDVLVVVPKRSVTRYKSPAKPVAKEPPAVKFDLPIRPRSIRRTSGQRKWTVSYVNSTARGVPRESPKPGTMLDRARYNAKPKITKPSPKVLNSEARERAPRERYSKMTALFPNYKPPSPPPAVSTNEEDNDKDFLTVPQAPRPEPEPKSNPDLLTNIKPSKATEADTETVKPSSKVPSADSDTKDRLAALRDAIANAQEEVRRLETAEKASRRQRSKSKSGSLLTSLYPPRSKSATADGPAQPTDQEYSPVKKPKSKSKAHKYASSGSVYALPA